jgi:uncharacterized membrane protein YhiD involved in acid resistance
MDTQQRGWLAPPANTSPPAPPGVNLLRIAVGAATIFVVMVVLYGLNTAAMLVAALVICTAGFGLIPAVFASWLVGLVVLAVWDAVAKAVERREPPVSGDTSGR